MNKEGFYSEFPLLLIFILTIFSVNYSLVYSFSNQTNYIDDKNTHTERLNGLISGLIYSDPTFTSENVPPDITTGNWTMDINNNTVSNFNANITMININGSPKHKIILTNFTNIDSLHKQFDAQGSILSLDGHVDISIDHNFKKSKVFLSMTIYKKSILSITLSPIIISHADTDIFRAKPIYGIVDSIIN